MKSARATKKIDYLELLGLEQNPFPVAPDDVNFFFSEHIDKIVTEIVHGVMARKGFMVLTGDVGLGKTTIGRRIIDILAKKGVETSLVFHTSLQDEELLREINRDFGINIDRSGADKKRLGNQMNLLNRFLLEQNKKKKNCAIIIDDAQNLNPASLELVRMISNLEAGPQKLVQILLIGQPELMKNLNSHKLRQLQSRIIIRKEALPLSLEDLKDYIIFKFSSADNRGQIRIEYDAFKRIHRFTKGNLRRVNILMDRCLYAACLHNTRHIDQRIVQEAYLDLFPEKIRMKNSLLVMSLILAMCLVAGGGWLTHSFSSRHGSERRAANTSLLDNGASANLQTFRELDQLNDGQSSEPPTKKEKVSLVTPVTEFLRSLNLSSYKNAFVDALKKNKFHDLADYIFNRTGYRLIQLSQLPEYIQGKYDILKYPLGPGRKNAFFLFWQPQLTIEKFHYFYQSKDIYRLQKLLANIHLYDDKPDTIVGTQLMKSVINFQKKEGLTVTGYPDEATLFLLFHQKENM